MKQIIKWIRNLLFPSDRITPDELSKMEEQFIKSEREYIEQLKRKDEANSKDNTTG